MVTCSKLMHLLKLMTELPPAMVSAGVPVERTTQQKNNAVRKFLPVDDESKSSVVLVESKRTCLFGGRSTGSTTPTPFVGWGDAGPFGSTELRTLSVGAFAHRTINECIEHVVPEAVVLRIILETLATDGITPTGTNLDDAFAFDAIVQIFELFVFGIFGWVDVGVAGTR